MLLKLPRFDLYVTLSHDSKLTAFRWPDGRTVEVEAYGVRVVASMRR